MTTTQTTHTTGTWTIRPATKPHGIERSHDVAIMDSDGEIIAECFEKVGRTSEGRFIERPAYANAAHIVHCVNTYPALLAALKRIIELADDPENEKDSDLVDIIDWDHIRRTIALAEGSQP